MRVKGNTIELKFSFQGGILDRIAVVIKEVYVKAGNSNNWQGMQEDFHCKKIFRKGKSA